MQLHAAKMYCMAKLSNQGTHRGAETVAKPKDESVKTVLSSVQLLLLHMVLLAHLWE